MKALVTGGAGFIGSHVAEALVRRGDEVRVLDNLFSGYVDNVPTGADLVEGDVADSDLVRKVLDGVDVVFHQAAHRAVARSVDDPLATDTANTHGTLTMLEMARRSGVKRVVCASSSSVYGGADMFPTPETAALEPRSPYAVSKLAGEHYGRVFAELHAVTTVSLRYFNVYGPRQRPDSAYAAVIPLFIDALRTGRQPEVHGDGKQSRDFTFIEDVVSANLLAATADPAEVAGRAFNIGGGGNHSLLDLLAMLGEIIGIEPRPVFVDPRPGDIRRSQADVSAAARSLGYEPKWKFAEGLEATVAEQPRR